MKPCCFVTVTARPALGVPCDFTTEGLPVGGQIAGRQQDEIGVPQLASAFEQATGIWKLRAPVAA